ncbi:MAG: hypothetical protein R3Y05_02065, partial [bacterium]
VNMKIKEAKKISKIVDELFLYFVKHGHANINLDIKITDEQIKIEITLENLDNTLLNKIKERLQEDREIEVEEYGWELMGESDCSNELELIGLLIDTVEHKVENNLDILTFIRKRSKK